MTAGRDDPHTERTVRRWRRLFLGVYLTFTLSAIVIAFLSVLAVHCGGRPPSHKGPQIGEEANDPTELRGCQVELERLLRDLHREALVVQQKALRFDTDPAVDWQNWSPAWRARWQALGHRCRLEEPAARRRSPEIDKMSNIHKALDSLQLAYSDLVSRYIGDYVQQFRALRGQLQDVRNRIDRRKPPAPGATPDPTGATR